MLPTSYRHKVNVDARAAEDWPGRRCTGLTPLHHAARCGHADVAVALLTAGADVEAACVSEHGRWERRCAVRDGVDGDSVWRAERSEACTPLALACTHGHAGVVKALLTFNADVNADVDGRGLTPLARATSAGHDAIAALLLAHGATPLALPTPLALLAPPQGDETTAPC